MAAKKGKRGKKSGGSMMSMRSGFKNAVGTGKKKKKGKGPDVTMQQVLFWSFLVAIVIVLIWRLTR